MQTRVFNLLKRRKNHFQPNGEKINKYKTNKQANKL